MFLLATHALQIERSFAVTALLFLVPVIYTVRLHSFLPFPLAESPFTRSALFKC